MLLQACRAGPAILRQLFHEGRSLGFRARTRLLDHPRVGLHRLRAAASLLFARGLGNFEKAHACAVRILEDPDLRSHFRLSRRVPGLELR